MNYKELFVSALVALVVATGVIYLAPANKQIVREVVKEVQNNVGAFAGPNITTDCLIINGQRQCYYRQSFQQATSTICNIAKPIGATSTLAYFAVNMRTGASTSTKGSLVDIGLNTGAGVSSSGNSATTSSNVIGTSYWIPKANQSAYFTASTSAGSALTDVTSITATTQYANAFAVLSNQNAGDYRGFAPSGYCDAVWYVDAP